MIRFKYQLKKLKAKQRLKQDRRPDTQELEGQAVDVFLKALNDKNSVLTQDPNQSQRMIENFEKEMLIVLDTNINKVTVTNSIFQYERKVSLKASDYLVRMFTLSQAKRANRTRTKYKSKVKKSLNLIIEEFDK